MNREQREFKKNQPKKLGHGTAVTHTEPEGQLLDIVQETVKMSFCLPNVEKEMCLPDT